MRAASAPVVVPAPGWQAFYPNGIASNRSGALVVWSDTRADAFPPDLFDTSAVFAARVGQGGNVLDPTGIELDRSDASEVSPAVAAGSAAYFAVWKNDPMTIEGVRVTPAGQVLDHTPIVITSSAGTGGGSPAVAWDGAAWLVAWTQGSLSASVIEGARVAPDGTVMDPGGFQISDPGTASDSDPSLAWDGTHFLVSWERGVSTSSDVYAARVAPDGTVLDPNGIPISTAPDFQFGVSLAWSGAEFLVVWTDQNSPTDVSGARVLPDGTVLDPNGFPIGVSGPGIDPGTGVAWDGTDFVVAFRRMGSEPGTTDIFVSRVRPDGTIIDPSGILIETGSIQYLQSLAFDGRNTVIAWGAFGGSDADVSAARFRPDGTVLDPNGFTVSTSADAQLQTAAAFDGTHHLVVWSDLRGDQYDVYGARVSPQGRPLDGTGIPISTAEGTQTVPTVAWNGSEFLVAWQNDKQSSNSSEVFGARVLPDGTVLDTTALVIATATRAQTVPDVTSDGSNFFVVWEDTRNGNGSVFDVLGTRVAPDGTVLDPNGIPIASGPTEANQHTPSVAFDGTNYLVAWSVNGGGTNSSDIAAARVAIDGTVLDPNGIVVSAASANQTVPDVAWNGSDYLVVWQDSGSRVRVVGARVSPDGTVLDPGGVVIADAGGQQTLPAVAPDGSRWLVAWQDDRLGTEDVYAARVAPDGTVLDPNGLSVADSAENERRPSLSTTHKASVLIAYDRFSPGPATNSLRAFSRAFFG